MTLELWKEAEKGIYCKIRKKIDIPLELKIGFRFYSH
jgi:hypothetical protein